MLSITPVKLGYLEKRDYLLIFSKFNVCTTGFLMERLTDKTQLVLNG